MNKTEYIGKLNALYVGEKNCLEELITIYDEKDKEIERLKKRNKEIYEGFMTTTEELCEATKEIERLNNIINELEKDLQSNIAYYDNLYEEQDEQEYIDKYFALKEVFEKLQELKGSEKE